MFGEIKLWLLGAFGLLAAFAAAFLKGRRSAADRIIAEQNKTYIETRKRIDETSNPNRDARAARQWLQSRGK